MLGQYGTAVEPILSMRAIVGTSSPSPPLLLWSEENVARASSSVVGNVILDEVETDLLSPWGMHVVIINPFQRILFRNHP